MKSGTAIRWLQIYQDAKDSCSPQSCKKPRHFKCSVKEKKVVNLVELTIPHDDNMDDPWVQKIDHDVNLPEECEDRPQSIFQLKWLLLSLA